MPASAKYHFTTAAQPLTSMPLQRVRYGTATCTCRRAGRLAHRRTSCRSHQRPDDDAQSSEAREPDPGSNSGADAGDDGADGGESSEQLSDRQHTEPQRLPELRRKALRIEEELARLKALREEMRQDVQTIVLAGVR